MNEEGIKVSARPILVHTYLKCEQAISTIFCFLTNRRFFGYCVSSEVVGYTTSLYFTIKDFLKKYNYFGVLSHSCKLKSTALMAEIDVSIFNYSAYCGRMYRVVHIRRTHLASP